MKKTILAAGVLFGFVCCAQANHETAAAQNDSTASLSSTQTPATDTTASAPGMASATSSTRQENKTVDYKNKVAEIHTSAGEIDVRFFPDKAPNHVKNFIDLAESGFYNGIKFHRVIPNFMIQGGDPNTKTGAPETWGTGGSPNKVKAEFNDIHHARGILSMARTSDPNSASSQFFIMVADAPSLDNQYSAFGKVIRGMEVADKIVNAPTVANDRPRNPTSIERIVIRDAKPGELK